ncbi:hypothetical protein STEG23_001387, partial [Scotinomys teguina]
PAGVSEERGLQNQSCKLSQTQETAGYPGEISAWKPKRRPQKKEKISEKMAPEQVQFSPGQSTATWKVELTPDNSTVNFFLSSYNNMGEKTVRGIWKSPGQRKKKSRLNMASRLDMARAALERGKEEGMENGGKIMREAEAEHGESSSAIGTIPATELSWSDYVSWSEYVSQPEDNTSMLHFKKGETEKTCQVLVINDSL